MDRELTTVRRRLRAPRPGAQLSGVKPTRLTIGPQVA